MIRLTSLLVAGLGLTMLIAGENPAEGDPPAATRTAFDPAGVRIGTEAADAVLFDDPAAIERAVAAVTVPAAAVPSQAATPDYWVVTGNRVNLRGGPSTSDAIVGQVGEGQRAEVLERTDSGWLRIRTEGSATDAWIFGRFLQRQV
ncbi:SH3 domain-containing protein [Oceaniovalibus guishaninsula]|nr:SH3 domain-containing protein [Oceaniovalibus guishaninsula]